MVNILTQLRIDEIASVDKGAGEGVKIVLIKRDLNSISKREDKPMNRTEELREIIKANGGMTDIAKGVIAEDGTSLTEHEYTELWEAEAGGKSAHAKEFAGPRTVKHVAYDIVHNVAMLKVLKAKAPGGYPNLMRTEPSVVGGKDATDVNDPAEAARQLAALVAEQRRLAPALKVSRLYEIVMADPANKKLVDTAFRSSPSYDATM